ncbi:MAG: class II aldolase/adducin family protein [Proteobacteria bacterium]|nr:class II aldolase/adducin family protein [Pseudomonadota bacterium]MDA1057956.1 class II aldolase/adducin family protein [Pseudomonadota bacterium]
MTDADFDVHDVDLRGKVSDAEWQVRCDLAACYRLCDEFGIVDRINTHISARVPDSGGDFLLNPVGLLFDEVTASSLVRIDRDGNKTDPDHPYDVNPAGYVIHSAVLNVRSDIMCVIHHHSLAGIAVAGLKEGLLPVSQHALQFYDRIAYHDYEGFPTQDNEECARMARNLGNHRTMFLRNHGVVVGGRSVGEAFCVMDDLEKACEAQLMMQATGRELHLPSPEMCERTAQQFENIGRPRGETEWPAMKRLLDRQGMIYAV